MKTTKRVMAALMAALVIMMTTYNAYTVPVNAASVVIGGVTISLVDLIAGFIAAGLAGYIGYECLEDPDIASELIDFLTTDEGTSALVDFVDHCPAGTVFYGDVPEPPKPPKGPRYDPDEIQAMRATGLIVNQALINLVQNFIQYLSDSKSEIGAAINDAENQDVYFVNPILPDNVYIGFNNNVIPGFAVMNGFDESLSHIQFYCSDLGGYAAGQIAYGEYNGIYGNEHNTLSLRNFKGDYKISSQLIYGIIENGATNYISVYGYNLPAYIFTAPGSVNANGISEPSKLYDFGFSFDIAYEDKSRPIYISPSITQPVLYEYRENDFSYKYYLIYESGVVTDGVTAVSPSGVSTAEDRLLSVKPIVNKDVAAYIKTIGDALINVNPDEAPVLSPEAINQIYNNVSEYYDQTVQNYYNDPQYITENEYITNITNIYQEAAENVPNPNPSPVSPVIGSLDGYKAVGLSEVFPFCIPFDMYDLMSILAAEPKAISFDYTFYFGEYFDEYTYTVDLSIFDPVMKVVRTMELLAYIFGLMYVTRNLIRG